MAGRKTQKCHAVVLDRTKLGEQDLILTMLSLEGEQVRAVAKGARKPGSRLAARMGLFSDVEMLLSVGRGLPIVAEAEVMHQHEALALQLEALSCASAMCEISRLTAYEGMSDAFLHPVLMRALDACEQVAADRMRLDVVYAAYTLKVLSHCGWRPVLDECVACGDPNPSWFSALAGGVLCDSCTREVEGAYAVSANQIGWIGALIGLTFDQLLKADVNNQTAAFVAGMARQWAQTHLDARLRASEFFANV